MAFILVIEPDRRQASRVEAIARDQLHAELVVAESTDEALQKLAERTPDLILTSLLLSPRDEARLADRLRALDAAGTHVQTLVIPVLAGSTPTSGEPKGLLTRLRRHKKSAVTSDGCDPAVFGAQIAEYLERLAADQRSVASSLHAAAPGEPRPALKSAIRSPQTRTRSPYEKGVTGKEHAESTRHEHIAEPELLGVEPGQSQPPSALGGGDLDLRPDESDAARPDAQAAPGDLVQDPDTVFAIDTGLSQSAQDVTDGPSNDTFAANRRADEQSRESTGAEAAGVPLAGGEGWEAPGHTNHEGATGDAETSGNTDSGDADLVLSAESIDLAAFVIDLEPSVADSDIDDDAAPDPAPVGKARQAMNGPAVAGNGGGSASSGALAEENVVGTEPWMAQPVGHVPDWPSIEGMLAEDSQFVVPLPSPPPTVQPAAARGVARPSQSGKANRRNKRKKRKALASAPQDESSYFDPEQCGFAALIDRLEDVAPRRPAASEPD